ncbi:MAG: 5-formyltetrahydrofolate cyclo-ligase [Proteobacteria bacterium]|nr:5-formyltetrahydrofolate cyclo-ligase [Pseudomonadota bacterium]
MSVDNEKNERRLLAKGNRAGFAHKARVGAAAKLADNFFQSGPGSADPSLVVAGYWPMADEIDVRPLMTRLFEAGWTVALPVVVAPKTPLIFRRWQPDMVLDAAGFGTHHPKPKEPEISPQLLLVPLLAFDDEGFRLGWGGGFYDRTLARLRAAGPVVAVGVAYHGQRVDHVPHTPADEAMDWIITDEDILEISRP